MLFHSQLVVRFADEDRAGIVYAPRFFHFFHCAWEDFWLSNQLSLRTSIEEDAIGWPVVHAEASFLQPVHFGEVLCIEVAVISIGRSSVVMRYRGRLQGREALTAEGTMKAVCVAMGDRRPIDIPDKYRQILQRFQLP